MAEPQPFVPIQRETLYNTEEVDGRNKSYNKGRFIVPEDERMA